MPVYVYDLDGETKAVYAWNIEEAADEVYALFGQHPDSLKEAS